MPERSTSTENHSPAGKDDSELARQQQEILRLRDLLITKDAELGAAKGRLAEIDDRSARIANIAARLESSLPGLGRIIGTALRMLRTQRR